RTDGRAAAAGRRRSLAPDRGGALAGSGERRRRIRGPEGPRGGRMSELHHRSLVELSDDVRAGKLSAVELTKSFLDRVAALDPKIHAYLHVDREGALAAAAAVDRKRAAGETLGALAGVPIAVKDNLCTRGVPTTCASKILEGYVPPYDAHVVE